jgi:hypothetical protein
MFRPLFSSDKLMAFHDLHHPRPDLRVISSTLNRFPSADIPLFCQPVPLGPSNLCGTAANAWANLQDSIVRAGGMAMQPAASGICAINASAAAQVI